MSARYVRFQRSDINVVATLIAVVEVTKKSEFVIVIPFDNGGRFLQHLNAALVKYAKQNRQMLKYIDRISNVNCAVMMLGSGSLVISIV